ncbi:TetR/AcrR family transcriptional regulator [Streptomyces sp. NPDC014676]|uniref:TetR/AcrR family transcriptional regulator n=1 Tax=Streptomyces sp. NPDC014676 TaxID=3364879 RepID=UPI0036FAE469
MPRSAMGKPPTKRQLAAEQTRRKLLDAALDNFSRRPYAEVTVGEIARSAGVAHGLLSHHFNGKENLYAEVVREINGQLRAAAQITAEGSAEARVRRHLSAHFDFLAAHEDAAVNLILRRAGATDIAWEAFEATRRESIRGICALLNLDSEEPSLELPMRGFVVACDEMALQWLHGGRSLSVGAMVDFCMAFLAGALEAAHGLAPTLALRAALEEFRRGFHSRPEAPAGGR